MMWSVLKAAWKILVMSWASSGVTGWSVNAIVVDGRGLYVLRAIDGNSMVAVYLYLKKR